jgi:hypothetical protein
MLEVLPGKNGEVPMLYQPTALLIRQKWQDVSHTLPSPGAGSTPGDARIV